VISIKSEDAKVHNSRIGEHAASLKFPSISKGQYASINSQINKFHSQSIPKVLAFAIEFSISEKSLRGF
jgi:hypothetical protein